mmetsp:Transcript_32114/g.93247  ORF Transcript_32114/g.93247 Transcript_32114/m.93247 type:complete len:235 (+) Transcript_32114:2894-3598(+)
MTRFAAPSAWNKLGTGSSRLSCSLQRRRRGPGLRPSQCPGTGGSRRSGRPHRRPWPPPGPPRQSSVDRPFTPSRSSSASSPSPGQPCSGIEPCPSSFSATTPRALKRSTSRSPWTRQAMTCLSTTMAPACLASPGPSRPGSSSVSGATTKPFPVGSAPLISRHLPWSPRGSKEPLVGSRKRPLGALPADPACKSPSTSMEWNCRSRTLKRSHWASSRNSWPSSRPKLTRKNRPQ